MGNLVKNVNIDPELVNNTDLNGSNEQKEHQSSFDTKNYLNVRLDKEKGETSKEITIRLLPMDLEKGYPFVTAHFHNIRVKKDIFGTEWKSYVCLSKNKDINHEKFGDKCPLCEQNKKAYELAEKETDPEKKKSLQKVSCGYKSNEAVIVRCIERGKENEGVKFWKFNLRDDKADPYNQIMDLFRYKRKKSIEKGEATPENILDLYEGRDLIISIKSTEKSNSTNITIRLDDDKTPLTTDEELLKKWVYDEKTWQEVFPPKDYDYINLVIQGKYPWFDKKNNKWVDKDEFNKNKEQQSQAQDKEIEAADEKLKGGEPEKYKEETSDLAESIELTDDDEELPF